LQEENINLSEFFDVIKRKYKLIGIITAVFVIVSIILSFFVITPKYQVEEKLFVGKAESKINHSYDNNEVQMYQNLLSTYSDVIMTDDLVQTALNESGINLESKNVIKNLQVTPKPNTQIIDIIYDDTNPQRAVNVIEGITKVFIKKSKELIPNSNVQVIERANYPIKPVSPNKTLYILIAFILGILVGIGVALALEFMDNTFRSKDDLEKSIGLPVIGTIIDYAEEEDKSSNVSTRSGRNKSSRRIFK
jgi:capsular polysaccharide biosynthesis protein